MAAPRANAIINVPRSIRAGDIITVRTLIQHAMETGYRRDAGGNLLARDLIRRMEVTWIANGQRSRVFAADLHAAIAANPLVTFPMKVEADGEIEITWRGDLGFAHTQSLAIKVAR
jgi:sulfur-oxidizing protein SoxZ